MRLIGASDLVLVPGLLAGEPRWPFMVGRAALNLGVAAYFRTASPTARRLGARGDGRGVSAWPPYRGRRDDRAGAAPRRGLAAAAARSSAVPRRPHFGTPPSTTWMTSRAPARWTRLAAVAARWPEAQTTAIGRSRVEPVGHAVDVVPRRERRARDVAGVPLAAARARRGSAAGRRRRARAARRAATRSIALDRALLLAPARHPAVQVAAELADADGDGEPRRRGGRPRRRGRRTRSPARGRRARRAWSRSRRASSGCRSRRRCARRRTAGRCGRRRAARPPRASARPGAARAAAARRRR